APQRFESDGLVGELVGPDAQKAGRPPRAETNADGARALGQAGDVGVSVRTGDGEDLVTDPDDVDAAVREDALSVTRRAGPHASDVIGQRRVRLAFPVADGDGQPTAPSICSSMSRLHSTAYCIGRVRVTGSMKPLT